MNARSKQKSRFPIWSLSISLVFRSYFNDKLDRLISEVSFQVVDSHLELYAVPFICLITVVGRIWVFT